MDSAPRKSLSFRSSPPSADTTLNGGTVRSLTHERDLAAVGRPRRCVSRAGSAREAAHVRRSHQRDVDVPVVLLRAVPRERDLFAVGRKRGIDLPARQRRERHDAQWRGLPRAGIAAASAAAADDQQHGGRKRHDQPGTTSARDWRRRPRTGVRLLLDLGQIHPHVGHCWKRFAGSFRRQRRIVRSRSCGRDGMSVAGGVGCSASRPTASRPVSSRRTPAGRWPSRTASRRS